MSLITNELFLQFKSLANCHDIKNMLKNIHTFEDFKKLNEAPNIIIRMFYDFKSIVPESILPELEDVILTNSYASYCYAKEVIKGRWKKGEGSIKKHPFDACLYAMYVIKGRWEEGEETIEKSPYWNKSYKEFLNSLQQD